MSLGLRLMSDVEAHGTASAAARVYYCSQRRANQRGTQRLNPPTGERTMCAESVWVTGERP